MATYTEVTAAAAVVNPTTAASELMQIAQAYPGLWPQIIAHPAAYDGLLDWMVAQRPDLASAVATRRSSSFNFAGQAVNPQFNAAPSGIATANVAPSIIPAKSKLPIILGAAGAGAALLIGAAFFTHGFGLLGGGSQSDPGTMAQPAPTRQAQPGTRNVPAEPRPITPTVEPTATLQPTPEVTLRPVTPTVEPVPTPTVTVTAEPAPLPTPVPTVTVTVQPAPVDHEAEAHSQLNALVAANRGAVPGFYGGGAVSLSTKSLGTVWEGKTWTYSDILSEYQGLKSRYGNVLLVDPTLFSDKLNGEWYMVLLDQHFGTRAGAQAWCDSQGLSAGDCYAMEPTP